MKTDLFWKGFLLLFVCVGFFGRTGEQSAPQISSNLSISYQQCVTAAHLFGWGLHCTKWVTEYLSFGLAYSILFTVQKIRTTSCMSEVMILGSFWWLGRRALKITKKPHPWGFLAMAQVKKSKKMSYFSYTIVTEFRLGAIKHSTDNFMKQLTVVLIFNTKVQPTESGPSMQCSILIQHSAALKMEAAIITTLCKFDVGLRLHSSADLVILSTYISILHFQSIV